VIADLARWLLDPSGLTPHGFCLTWQPWLIWTHALADIAIGLAYFSIPLALATFARRRRDLVFKPVFWMFAAFILLCGTGHWLDLLTLWVPAYGAEAMVKAATATVSVVTAVALWPLMPKALALPSPAQLRAADEALHDSAERHRRSFLGAPVALHILDAEGRVVEVSDRWLDLLGYGRAEVVGRPVAHFLDAEFAAEHRKRFPAFLGEEGVEVWDLPRRFVRRDGTALDALVSARRERSAGGRVHVIASLVDVTARRRAEAALRESEERLRHAQKMEAIGQLTGGVAHDFNNVLQAVTGNLELIRRRVREDRPDVARLAGNALDAAEKATGLTSQLLAFARRQRLDPRPFDPVEVVEGMRGLLTRMVGERIVLRVEAEPDVGACLADPNQLEAALLNLAINARDAIDGEEGTITVLVRGECVAAASDDWPPSGEYVRIAVRDDGPGMTEEVRRRAFEPFFTTKPSGKGTGLGLAQIHGFAHQSGGTALVESAPGQGTEVAILLPRSVKPARRCVEATGPAPEPEAGFGEMVLVVEDDAMVRAALAETLRDLRYRVVEAADADTALAMLDSGVAADVVLSDVMMPGSMDGVEFAAVARERFPRLPLILTTGRADVLGGRPLPPGVDVLRKPHSRSGIAAALRCAVAEAQEPVGV
jgi:PAS domain S-box-containing protein